MALGAKLKQAREALGMSEHDVAEQTHIMVQIIRELETEDYHRFSAAIYGKGFVKLYAKVVGLDPAPLVAEFLADYEDGAGPKQKPRIVLETIDLEPGGGITQVATTGGPEHPQERRAEEKPKAAGEVPESAKLEKQNDGVPPQTPSLPSSVKASTVTMPNPNAKPVMLSPGRPAAMRAIPTLPPATASAPETPPQTQREQAAPQAAAAETQQTENVFKLQSDNVVPAIPPRPVKSDIEPFRYPTPPKSNVKHTQDQAVSQGAARHSPSASSADEDASELFAEPSSGKRRPAAPRIRVEKEKPGLADFARYITRLVSEFLDSVKERASMISGNDSEDARVKSRYYISIAAVLLLVVFIVIVAVSNSGKRSVPNDTLASTDPAVEELVGPVTPEDSAEGMATEIASSDVPAVETPLPFEIVRVLPPPKMFAR